jgi:hypothetical protein
VGGDAMSDNQGEWGVVIVFLVFVLVLIGGMAWAVLPTTQREKAEVVAARMCTDRGYQTWTNKHDVLYCET